MAMFSVRQHQALDLIVDGTVARVVLRGSVRSGKTHCAVWGFCHRATKHFDGGQFVIGVRQISLFEENIEPLIQAYCDTTGQTWTRRAKHYEMTTPRGGINRFVVVGGRDKASWKRVQGPTWNGALVDEYNLCDREFVEILEKGCSAPGAQIALLSNPTHVAHWSKRLYADRCKRPDYDGVLLKFKVADNPIDHTDYVRRMEETWLPGSAQHTRMILGEDAAESGVVFPDFRRHVADRPDEDQVLRWELSADYGTNGVTHVILWGLTARRAWAWDEWRYNAGERLDEDEPGGPPLSDRDLAVRIVQWLGQRSISRYYFDLSADSSLALAIADAEYEERGMAGAKDLFVPADKQIVEGINRTRRLLDTGAVRIAPQCRYLIESTDAYVWPEDSDGEDVRPVKDGWADHAIDTMRYRCSTWLMLLEQPGAEVLRAASQDSLF